MSNTVRRKKGYKGWGFGTVWAEDSSMGRVKASPEEVRKQLIRLQMDRSMHCGPSPWFKRREHKVYKMIVKTEIANFWKNPEYEIQVQNRKKVDYWD